MLYNNLKRYISNLSTCQLVYYQLVYSSTHLLLNHFDFDIPQCVEEDGVVHGRVGL